jgi:hypothetical protein
LRATRGEDYGGEGSGYNDSANDGKEPTGMAKAKERVWDATENVRPYVERAMKDEELRKNMKDAFDAARDVYNELIG